MRSCNFLLRVVTLALFSIFFFGCAGSKQAGNSFFFIQMSDPQFGFFSDNKDFEKETENFEKAISEANRLKPAFVVITGDLVNRAFDTAQINEYKRISKQLDPSIPLYSVPGNHDVSNTPGPEDIAFYRRTIGPNHYSFTHGSMMGIVLNSLYLKSPEKVPALAREQEEWLVKTLAEAKRRKYRHIIVFLHHSLFLKQANEPDEYFNIPLATRKKYLDILKAGGVKYIFAGHYHRNAFGETDGIRMVTTGPVGKPLGKDPSGFRIIRISGNEITHQYYSLDSIPSEIKL